jgi:hypothetical protein
MASIRFSRQAHGADVREQAVVAAMNGAPCRTTDQRVRRLQVKHWKERLWEVDPWQKAPQSQCDLVGQALRSDEA